MRDCTMVVTGASDGIGAAAARSLSDLGAAVVVAGRSAAKTSAVTDKLRADRYVAGFAHLDQVRELARQLTARYPRIDVLTSNAGLIATGTRTITGDGHKLTFRVNHLAPFLRTMLLREPLTHSQARVITPASPASTSRAASVVLDDLDAQRSDERWAPTPPASWGTCRSPENSPGAGDRPPSQLPPRTPAWSALGSAQPAPRPSGWSWPLRWRRRWLMAAAPRRSRPTTG